MESAAGALENHEYKVAVVWPVGLTIHDPFRVADDAAPVVGLIVIVPVADRVMDSVTVIVTGTLA